MNYRVGQIWLHDGVYHLVLISEDQAKFGQTVHRALTLDDTAPRGGARAPDVMKLFEFDESQWEDNVAWERIV